MGILEKLVDDLLNYIQQKILPNTDAIFQTIYLRDNESCTLVYLKTITDTKKVYDHLVTCLITNEKATTKELLEMIQLGDLFSTPVESCSDPEKIVQDILEGKTLILFSASKTVFLASLTKYAQRGVSIAQNEMVIVGPQEGFVENLETNLSLLRHRIKHPSFKVIEMKKGSYTNTNLCMLYMEEFCAEELIHKVKSKLESINLDSLMGVSFVSEIIEEFPASIFPQIQYTERPDTLAASLIEGRLGIMVDGTPMVLILPVTFFSLMQSAEDYYQRFWATTFIRWIRFLFVIISFLLPSLYIALTTFHSEIIPTTLLTAIAAARENIPFPTLLEAFIMELTFEGLREAGIRVPKPIGQTISIIGAIVIGQAAVQAGFVSSPIVIIVSITGIASFIIPHFELGLTFRLLRFPIMILGGTLGLFGIIIGIFLIMWHLVTLESFGVPYMRPLAPFVWREWRDVFVRESWKYLRKKSSPYQNVNQGDKE